MEQAISPSKAETTIRNENDDLTSQQLSKQFQEVLAYYKNQSNAANETTTNCSTNNTATLTLEQVSINLLRTRHAQLRLNRSRVDVSTIRNAGLGVFATRPIAVNELITLYPGDALLQWHNATDCEDRHGVRVLLGRPHIQEQERSDAMNKGTLFGRAMDAARAYEVRITGKTISVVGDPHRRHDAAYLGHLLNDGACLNSSSSSSTKIVDEYTRQSLSVANAKIVVGAETCHVELVATRPIAPGQEIFLSYGALYWLSRLPKQQQQQSPLPSSSSASSSSKPDQPLGFASPRNSKRRPRRA
jgi:SET domain